MRALSALLILIVLTERLWNGIIYDMDWLRSITYYFLLFYFNSCVNCMHTTITAYECITIILWRDVFQQFVVQREIVVAFSRSRQVLCPPSTMREECIIVVYVKCFGLCALCWKLRVLKYIVGNKTICQQSVLRKCNLFYLIRFRCMAWMCWRLGPLYLYLLLIHPAVFHHK